MPTVVIAICNFKMSYKFIFQILIQEISNQQLQLEQPCFSRIYLRKRR